MAYQTGYYFPHNDKNVCAQGTYWFPDGTGDIRNQITAAYMSYYGRYGEQTGVQGYVTSYNSPGNTKTINQLVYEGGLVSGEQQAVNLRGRHTGMSTGTCPPFPSATFYASPSSIVMGNSSTLYWSTSGVTSVSITNIIGVGTSGSRTVSPTSSTTYILTASGIRGTVTKSVTVTVTIPPPPTISFSISTSQICRGGTATLSWSVSGYVSSVSISPNIGPVGTSGSRAVSPTSSTLYSVTANGIGGTNTKTAFLTVNQPTSTSIISRNSSIIRGQCTTLTWSTSGDATSATISPGIGSVNINGQLQVCPTETTNYQLYVNGICTNSYSSVTVVVYQPPTVEIIGPESLSYNQQATISYTATNVDISLVVTPTYTYKNTTITATPINLPTGSSVSGTIDDNISYNDYGPTSVSYVITATGNGGQETKQITIPINIDETPENILIPESEDLLKGQEPIYAPDEVVTSYKIILNDTDIPVEIKADKPILVDVNEQDSWEQLRRIQ